MKACLKRPCLEPTSIQNVGTNIIDELIETLEGNQHLAKQLKALKTNRHTVSEIRSIVLDKIVRLEEENREIKTNEDAFVETIAQERQPENMVEAMTATLQDELKSEKLKAVIDVESNFLGASSDDVDIDVENFVPQFYECLKSRCN